MTRKSKPEAPEAGGIVVLDFGSQYTQLIARRIRDHNVFSVIVPCGTPPAEIEALQPAGLVLSGGPSSVYDPDAPQCDPRVLELGKPVLGICYGLQWIAHQLGGKVERAARREYGPADLKVENHSQLFAGLPRRLKIWNSHGDHIVSLPPGFRTVGTTANAVAAAENAERRIYAVQFHPEVRHTECGDDLLRNFVFNICRAQPTWNPRSFIEKTVENIRRRVGAGKRALCALSGGVDSTVAATLVHRALGDRLFCLFVDNGLLRKNEFPLTLALLHERLKLNVVGVEAAGRFLEALRGVTDPEEKRRRIGALFIRIFEEEAGKLGGVEYLVQGTLYPDVIESVSVRGPSATIKTHHNVGGLPTDIQFRLLEPLRELFKDEVRRIGRELALPDEVLQRQPFPGPGLAVRCLGEVTPERLETLRAADEIVDQEVRRAGLYHKLWQAFAVLLPVRTVGVMGDQRSYANVLAVRAVESEDGMTADWARLPAELLERLAARIVNEVPGINRVVYDVSSKPPSTIEWE
ncbi:glutamine-hydrolyzing GMP synthase [Acidobacteriia bacterium AH_259_A11_L15]|nr:glutamine-hydrolyzing GMP synthase [Acidobacteriia bacterium AH_259_A11_L15]